MATFRLKRLLLSDQIAQIRVKYPSVRQCMLNCGEMEYWLTVNQLSPRQRVLFEIEWSDWLE